MDAFAHEVEKYEALARLLGLPAGRCEPRLHGYSRPAKRGGVLLWPGSGSEEKRWPLEHFRDTARALGRDGITIGCTPAEEPLARQLAEWLGAPRAGWARTNW